MTELLASSEAVEDECSCNCEGGASAEEFNESLSFIVTGDGDAPSNKSSKLTEFSSTV